MKIVKHYRDNAALRAGFNALAEATFGLNFENWYRNGFWTDCYAPYSVVEDGKVVANVSLNRTDMRIGGEVRRLYQLGTVMTDPAYRNRGYIRAIMAEIEKDTTDADGVYLFGNDSVLEFYPKFGFQPGKEFEYSKILCQAGDCTMVRMPQEGPGDWAMLRRAMEENTLHSACDMVGNPGLIFFYASQFMKDCVYRHASRDIWAIAEEEEDHLLLHNIFSAEAVTVDEVVGFFGGVRSVTLGFTPADPAGFDCRELKEEDCTFFVKGGGLSDFEARKLRIPSLSHA